MSGFLTPDPTTGTGAEISSRTTFDGIAADRLDPLVAQILTGLGTSNGSEFRLDSTAAGGHAIDLFSTGLRDPSEYAFDDDAVWREAAKRRRAGDQESAPQIITFAFRHCNHGDLPWSPRGAASGRPPGYCRGTATPFALSLPIGASHSGCSFSQVQSF
jgi:hypothetical protein